MQKLVIIAAGIVGQLVGADNIPLNIGFGCDQSKYPNVADMAMQNPHRLIWSHKISSTANETSSPMHYISLHFSWFHIPEHDYLLLTNHDGIIANLSETRPSGMPHDPFFAIKVPFSDINLELYRSNATQLRINKHDGCNLKPCYGLTIDFMRQKAHMINKDGPVHEGHETICGADNSIEARCALTKMNTHQPYIASRSVARMLIHKEDFDAVCTGFLFGCEGHFITNHHCIGSKEHAKHIEIEFMAEGSTCSEACDSYWGCPGTVEATSAEVIIVSHELDFALLKLDRGPKLIESYGYYHMRNESARLGEEIYVPQHPLGWGKRLAMTNDDGLPTSVTSISKYQCGVAGIEYDADTQGGASGSPVVALSDAAVIALHHCGATCSNTGVPSSKIIEFLHRRNLLPKCALEKNSKADTDVSKSADDSGDDADFQIQHVIEGVITMNKTLVGVDHITFTLEEDDEVILDLLSVEISNDGEYVDINGDCKATFIDGAMYLFRTDTFQQVAFNDDSDYEEGQLDGSISVRDPYIHRDLKKGTYMIALGSVPFDRTAALQGFSNEVADASIFSCLDTTEAGGYRLTVSSRRPIHINSRPQSPAPVKDTCLSNSTICSI